MSPSCRRFCCLQLEEELRQRIEEEVRRRMLKFKDIEKEHAAQLEAAHAAARAAEAARDEASGLLFEAQEVRCAIMGNEPRALYLSSL